VQVFIEYSFIGTVQPGKMTVNLLPAFCAATDQLAKAREGAGGLSGEPGKWPVVPLRELTGDVGAAAFVTPRGCCPLNSGFTHWNAQSMPMLLP
jgi:hypothetical protein